ncbi:hypothetical protein [Massilibacterium senegalense]|nr:hypothetical protein [Massilibacterium senegalense]
MKKIDHQYDQCMKKWLKKAIDSCPSPQKSKEEMWQEIKSKVLEK